MTYHLVSDDFHDVLPCLESRPRLSKLDQEQQQQVVKAEIVTYRQDTVQPVRQSTKPSAICSLQ